MRSAAVYLLLGKHDRDKNKSAYQFLLDRKDEIESALGASLDWWRFEKGKASYVNISCKDEVGMYIEGSWQKMAQFHAEWSKKFYDVFVPLLNEWNAGQY